MGPGANARLRKRCELEGGGTGCGGVSCVVVTEGRVALAIPLAETRICFVYLSTANRRRRSYARSFMNYLEW